ncbi:MAG: spore germination protein, partial [Lachnospiraceae bacterium]
MKFSKSLTENIETAVALFPIHKSFDLITREISFGNLNGYFIGINGFCNQELLQRLFSDLQNPSFFSSLSTGSLEEFIARRIGYSQVKLVYDWDTLTKNVLSGPCALLIDGFSSAIIIDTRSYPARSIEEPENEKVMRGSKDGFVETLLYNTNMIR